MPGSDIPRGLGRWMRVMQSTVNQGVKNPRCAVARTLQPWAVDEYGRSTDQTGEPEKGLLYG